MKIKNVCLLSVLVVLLFSVGCGSDDADDQHSDTGVVETDAGDQDVASGNNHGNVVPDALKDVDVLFDADSDPADPQSFESGQSIGGVLASSTGAEDDFDAHFFKVELTGGTVFEMEFSALGSGFDDEDGSMAQAWFIHGGEVFVRGLVSINGMKRQVFVPETGTYYIEISDLRAREEAHGGSESYYVLKTGTTDLEVESLAVPGELDGDASDAKLRAFSVKAPEDGVMIAQAFGWDPEGGNFFDPALYAWDPDADELVGYNEDVEPEYEDYDAEMAFPVEKDGNYVLVMDFYENTTPADFGLSVLVDDDHPEVPGVLELDQAVSGEISAAVDGVSDLDYFVVEIEPGQRLRIEVTGSDAMEPAIQVYDDWNLPVSMALPTGNRAAIEFSRPDYDEALDDDEGPVEYFIVMSDRRNLPVDADDEDEGVGGPTFGYSIKASVSDVEAVATPLPIDGDVVLDDVGTTLWYEVTVPANHIVQLEYTSEVESFEPVIVMLDEEGYDRIVLSPTAYISGDNEVKEVFGVRDMFFRGGAAYEGVIKFKAYDLSGVTYTAVDDIETNVSVETAQDVTLPVEISGELVGTSLTDLDADYFKVSLTEDTTLIVQADSQVGADMQVRLFKTDGTTVAIENDFYLGQDGSFYSAFVYDVPESGEYTLQIEPYCEQVEANQCVGNGDYTLKAFVATE